MRQFTVAPKENGRRLEKWMMSVATPALGYGGVCRALRLKRVRVNGKPAKEGTVLSGGDRVEIWLEDACFDVPQRENRFFASFHVRLDILYEDDRILLVDKRPGLRVHPDDEEKTDTLINHVRAYLYQKGEYDGRSSLPALCNRIDRFTGGIVIVAKTEAALKILDRKIRLREIRKYYLCAASGVLDPPEGVLEGWLRKEGKRVRVLSREESGAQYALTRYRTLRAEGGITLAECLLETGRTHQIRAQFAAAGHPLLGDTQYGDRAVNEKSISRFQQLYAWKITFSFAEDAGEMEYLNGKSFCVDRLHKGFEEIVSRLSPQGRISGSGHGEGRDPFAMRLPRTAEADAVEVGRKQPRPASTRETGRNVQKNREKNGNRHGTGYRYSPEKGDLNR